MGISETSPLLATAVIECGHSSIGVDGSNADSAENRGSAESTHEPAKQAVAKPLPIFAAKLGLCLVFMFFSTLLIILNKILIVDLKFHFPMIVTGMGMVVSAIGSYVFCHVLRLVPQPKTIGWRDVYTKLVPVGCFMATTMHTGNMAYLHLSLSFIQMMKAATPIITMLALFLAQLETPKRSRIYAVLLISFGTALSVYGEINLSPAGLTYMGVSEVAEAFRLVLTQYLLVGMQMHPMESLLYLAPSCLLWLGIGSWVAEWPVVLREGALQIVLQNKGPFLAAAVLGFGVNVMGYYVIQQMGSVTLKVLALIRNIVIVTVGIMLMGNIVTYLQILGYAIATAGFGWYNLCIMTE